VLEKLRKNLGFIGRGAGKKEKREGNIFWEIIKMQRKKIVTIKIKGMKILLRGGVGWQDITRSVGKIRT